MKEKEPARNRPTEEGRKNDPDLRDESAIQPGADTVSRSETDPANQHLTETAKDDFRTKEKEDKTADPRYDRGV